MSFLAKVFAAVFGLAEEAAHEAVKTVKASIAEATMTRDQARDKGRARMIVYAREKGQAYDPLSINDTFKLLRRIFRDGTMDELKQDLADELAEAGADDLADYRAGHATGPQNDKLVEELQIMVGYGDLEIDPA